MFVVPSMHCAVKIHFNYFISLFSQGFEHLLQSNHLKLIMPLFTSWLRSVSVCWQVSRGLEETSWWPRRREVHPGSGWQHIQDLSSRVPWKSEVRSGSLASRKGGRKKLSLVWGCIPSWNSIFPRSEGCSRVFSHSARTSRCTNSPQERWFSLCYLSSQNQNPTQKSFELSLVLGVVFISVGFLFCVWKVETVRDLAWYFVRFERSDQVSSGISWQHSRSLRGDHDSHSGVCFYGNGASIQHSCFRKSVFFSREIHSCRFETVLFK